MYKIGELSKLCSIPVKTLRYYDAEGLLIPDEIDSFTGYRYYSAAKLADCYRIIALKELGFSLDEIRKQLTGNDTVQIVSAMDARLCELEDEIRNAERRRERIQTLKNRMQKGENNLFHIIVRAADGMRVAVSRKLYPTKSGAWDQIEKIASDLPQSVVGKRRIVINYEIEYVEKDFDLAIGVELTGELPRNSQYEAKTLSFGESVASLVCRKETLNDAYHAIIRYLNESRYKACGAYYEIYHGDGTVELKVPVCERTDQTTFPTDRIELPFEDDPEVCGKWNLLDILPTREHFRYGKPKCGHLAWLHELYFIDGGQSYWSVAGWTKGYLFTYGQKPQESLANKYTLETVDNHRLLFLEMKDFCDGAGVSGGTPEIWVYEKVDDRHYTSRDEIRRYDNIDYPFIADPAVLGTWKVRDLVKQKEDFDPQKQNWAEEELFLKQIEFEKGGGYVSVTGENTNRKTCRWTKGLILNCREQTASAYEIRLINGVEYLFRQWKSGDYIFGGGRICWYVFVRA